MRNIWMLSVWCLACVCPSKAASPPQIAFVSTLFSDSISVFDLSTNTLITTIPVGLNSTGMAITLDGAKLYAASFQGGIRTIDAVSLFPLGTLAENSIIDLALTPDNLRLYAGSVLGQVRVYDFGRAQWVATIPGSTGSIAMAPDGKRVYTSITAGLAAGSVNVIDTATNTVVADVNVGRNPTRLYVHPVGTRLWVVNSFENSISIVDTVRNRVVSKIKLAANPVAIAFSPDGTKAFVTENAPYLLEVIETSQYTIIGSVPLPWSIDAAVSADGSRVYLTQLLDNTITVLDSSTLATVATISMVNPFYLQLSPVASPATRVYVDIKPGDYPNAINSGSSGTISVAILSTTIFDAPARINPSSLRFGRSGIEASVISCQIADVNNDTLPDLVCGFSVSATGFQLGDSVGLLSGALTSGQSLQGQDSVRIVQ